MNYIDLVLGGLLIIALYRGFKRGFIVEVTSLAGLLLGIYGAIFFSDYLSDILKNHVNWDKSMLQLVSFAGTFLIILIVIGLLGKVLTKLVEAMAMGILNKLAGALFSVFKVTLILSIILIIFERLNQSIPFSEKIEKSDSKLYEPVKNFAELVFPGLVKSVRENNQGIPEKEKAT